MVLFAPALHFELLEREQQFLSPACLDGKSKNISFRPATGAVNGASAAIDCEAITAMLRRYYEKSSALMDALCPEYRGKLSPGFTSFRPAEIAGRMTSWRKDDTRLHVDAFPSRPLEGLRIMRVFSNVNPEAPRMWRVGEPFEAVAKTFLPKIATQFPGSAFVLHALRVTKTRRTAYDHLMLGIHDGMKADENYQRDCPQVSLAIPPGATWACFTDSVSHAAMSGQFAFEQTFYLPVEAMLDPSRSPLRVLERLTGKRLTA
jgi:3-deoxy-D-manno-oct-2-ulosonic acid (Kdo) hydroxylase